MAVKIQTLYIYITSLGTSVFDMRFDFDFFIEILFFANTKIKN